MVTNKSLIDPVSPLSDNHFNKISVDGSFHNSVQS